MTAIQSLARQFQQEQGRATARLGNLQLHSVYQPIVSPALLRSVGSEALLRINDAAGALLPTQQFFTGSDSESIVKACLTARALHVLNAPPPLHDNDWLFINVHPQSIRHHKWRAAEIAEELESMGMPSSRLVLEVLESAALEDRELEAFVTEYRAAGFRIAIDDFGAGASNYDRVIGIQPDIVKLDRSLIANASASPRAQRLFPHVVALLRESGALVLVEGIETAEQAHIAIDADAELLQGWYFGHPDVTGVDEGYCRKQLESVMKVVQLPGRRSEVERFRSRFVDVWSAFRDGKPIDLIAQEVQEAQVTRIYAIDMHGYQIGDTALTRHAVQGSPHPLANARGACWSRRHYFRRATEQPGRVQVTRPYLSLTEQKLCVTYSCATLHKTQGQCVICMDVLVSADTA